jgi:hypothetical protein
LHGVEYTDCGAEPHATGMTDVPVGDRMVLLSDNGLIFAVNSNRILTLF